MRIENLDHEALLELIPDGGMLRFAGQRVVLTDAVALGVLRKYLIENFGLTAARAVLTQFGFAQGWRTAKGTQAAHSWNSTADWQSASLTLS